MMHGALLNPAGLRQILFEMSYSALSVMVATCAVVTQLALRRVVRHRRLREARGDRYLPVGALAPGFELLEMQTRNNVTLNNVRGRFLVFLSPPREVSLEMQRARTLLYNIHKIHKGNIAVVCEGSEEDCRRLTSHAAVATVLTGVPILFDPDGATTREYMAFQTPIVIRLDNEGRIAGYGIVK